MRKKHNLLASQPASQPARHIIRNSRVEILKILAMVMIVFSHAMPITRNPNLVNTEYLMDLNTVTTDIQQLIIILAKYGGQLGNAIFIVSSSWYLVPSNGERTFYKKIFRIAADTIAIYYGVILLCFLAGYRVALSDLLHCLLPIWMASSWFITCFIIYLIFVPLLNCAVNNLSLLKLKCIAITLFFIYGVLQVVLSDSFYYSHAIGFISLYLLVAYIQKAQLLRKMFAVRQILLAALGNMLLFLTTNLIGLKFNILSDDLLRWNKFMNPFLVIIAISMLSIALQKEWNSRFINYLASLSLLVYLFHQNKIVMTYGIAEIWNYIYVNYGYDYKLLWFMIVSILIFIVSFVLSILYRVILQKYVYKVCDTLYYKFRNIATK